MGYSGGTSTNPTYGNLGDHSESIQIDFDPTIVSYAELLHIFWESHNPATAPSCRQYMSAIFYHDDDQRVLAEATKQEWEAVYGTIYTEIAAVQAFYRAEDYHQKYHLRNRGILMRDFTVLYPNPIEFTDSTAAARVNGVVARYYTSARLEAELAGFGLSEEANEILRGYAQD